MRKKETQELRMQFSVRKILCLVLVVCVTAATANPQILFNLIRRATQRQRSGAAQRQGGRSYTDIARVINPNPYVLTGYNNGRALFPAQPFWPFG